ncbi:MAG: helix-turn-helix transcriptional regulator [Acidobacteria bacterium]|nr:helix-turn-helix transcriptional regulator [Acidobacteriota bacterium]
MSSGDAAHAATLFKTLGDPVRLRILSLVAASDGGELCACDLPGLLDRSQGTTSHHLSQLVAAGFLEREQRGKWAWFRVRSETLVGLAEALTPGALLSAAGSGDSLT